MAACAPGTAPGGGLQLAAAPGSQERFGEVPDFELTDQLGRGVGRADLLGAPWAIAPFFTTCAGPCPRLTADMRAELYDELAGTDVRLVSLTVDPERDDVAALADYAARFGADAERWLFLTGEEEAIHAFLRDGLMLAVDKRPLETPADPVERLRQRFEYSHATRIAAIDPEGRIAGFYRGAASHGAQGGELERAEVERELALLRARLLALDGRAPRSVLPLVNAVLNGTAFVLIVAGWLAIRGGRRRLHGWTMALAFAVSTAFLASYLYYHFGVQAELGPTRFGGEGAAKAAYLALLLSHVVLAVVNLPMVLRTVWLAARRDWTRHRRLARWTMPIWSYVSVTGVLVYLVLYHMNPALP